MKFLRLKNLLPDWTSAALAVLSAILLILAFPDFGFSLLAWFALAPLIWAIYRERESSFRGFILGWLWGFVFFSGTCWWLTFAPITYAGFPTSLAYFLLFVVTAIVGIFPGVFGIILGVFSKRFGIRGLYLAPFAWVFSEFLRYWLTGNNWNAIGYSQAFGGIGLSYASIGGIYFTSFIVVLWTFITSAAIATLVAWLVGITGAAKLFSQNRDAEFVAEDEADDASPLWTAISFIVPVLVYFGVNALLPDRMIDTGRPTANVIAIQPNVPMSGLTYDKWMALRHKHVELSESALATINDLRSTNTTVIFPESPMNFAYDDDREFRDFLHAFAGKNDVNVLFNSAEPDAPNDKYFNSAVLVGPDGKEIAQYDKIYLLPFGESVPAPLQSIVPAFVGSFSYGKEYDLLPLGDAKAGVMICFESHFGELSREYVREGADVLIEMTNDGYLGPTPVLRQHLANAVFRAVETNRPVLRVTNVGITAYISERGEVRDPAESYTEATRVWSVAKSDGVQTFYVRYGDWFAWLCSAVTICLLVFAIASGRRRRESVPPARAGG